MSKCRHCERSEAIHRAARKLDCFASLAMTISGTARHTLNRHRTRKRAIQYSRGLHDRPERPRRTGSPAFAGDDVSQLMGCLKSETRVSGSQTLEPEEFRAQRVLVLFFRGLDGVAQVVLLEVRLFPGVALGHVVVHRGQRFLLADGGDPG